MRTFFRSDQSLTFNFTFNSARKIHEKNNKYCAYLSFYNYNFENRSLIRPGVCSLLLNKKQYNLTVPLHLFTLVRFFPVRHVFVLKTDLIVIKVILYDYLIFSF